MNKIISLIMKTHFNRSGRKVKATNAAFLIPINIIKPKILCVRGGIAAPAAFKLANSQKKSPQIALQGSFTKPEMRVFYPK